MVKIGDKFSFDCLKDIKIRGMATGEEWVVGKVVEVHEKGSWFAVEYCLGEDNTKLRTCFHFADIGVSVYKGVKR